MMFNKSSAGTTSTVHVDNVRQQKSWDSIIVDLDDANDILQYAKARMHNAMQPSGGGWESATCSASRVITRPNFIRAPLASKQNLLHRSLPCSTHYNVLR